VQTVYIEADELTKRGYNQAFFKKLYVMTEWDDGETVAWISGVAGESAVIRSTKKPLAIVSV
jgi:hypothetical protein